MVNSFSLQIQHQLPQDTVVSIGYVGSVSSHLWQTLNLNYSPYGELFTKAAQDPSKYTGFTVPDVQPGIAQVYLDKGLQVRRFQSLRCQLPEEVPGIRHRPVPRRHGLRELPLAADDGAAPLRQGRDLCRCLHLGQGDGHGQRLTATTRTRSAPAATTTVVPASTGSTTWPSTTSGTPRVSRSIFFDNSVGRAIFDNWQLSGISQFQTGCPGRAQLRLDDRVRQRHSTSTRGCWAPGQKDRGFRWSENPVPTNQGRMTLDGLLRAPSCPTSAKLVAPRSWIDNPGLNVHDISIYKNFPLWSEKERFLQFRLEMFNAFNHPNFTGFNSGMTFQVADTAMTNYNAVKQASPTTVRGFVGGICPPTATTYRLGRGNGEINGQPGYVSANRVIEVALKLYF